MTPGISTYIVKRLILMIPTLIGISVINFTAMQLAPGGPVENLIANLRFSGSGQSVVTQEVIDELKKQYDFDKPLHVRYGKWLKSVVTLDFGWSHTFGRPVTELIKSKLPVSIRFGLLTLLLTYGICIPLGIVKGVKSQSTFDTSSSFVIFLLYSIPAFILAIVLIVFLAGGSYWNIFPIGGLRTLGSEDWTPWEKFIDECKHMFLPIICLMTQNLALTTLFMKNSLLEEMSKDYIRTALAKGCSQTRAILRHGIPNAILSLIPGFSGVFLLLLTSNLLIERIFNLDGFGKLFFDAALQRDYPVLMAQVVFGAGLAMLGQLFSDVLLAALDPRVTFK